MKVVFDENGVIIEGVLIPYASTDYDMFVEILQSHGLRNLVENVSKFTITNKALINDLKNEYEGEIDFND